MTGLGEVVRALRLVRGHTTTVTPAQAGAQSCQ